MNNRIRADWAMGAAMHFARETRMDIAGEDTETILGDLVANIMHLCDREGIDFDAIITQAANHHHAEIEEEGRLSPVRHPARNRIRPTGFNPAALTDDQITEVVFEMRRRGHAVAPHDVDEILTRLDTWTNKPSREAIEGWFDRDEIEAAMNDAVMDLIEASFCDCGDDDDPDYDEDGNLRPGVDH